MINENSQSGKSYSSIVRLKIMDSIARLARSGGNWKEIFAEAVAANNITPEEVEEEIQRINSAESVKNKATFTLCPGCGEETTMDEILCKRCKLSFQRGSRKLQRLIVLDAQTDFYDIRTFSNKMEDEIKRHKHCKRPLSLCIIAVDKVVEMIRLQYWPDYEAAVKAIANVLRECLTNIDIASYFGPGAFHVLLPETDTTQARTIIEKFLLKLNAQVNTNQDKNFAVTATVGIASLPAHTEVDFPLGLLAEDAFSKAVNNGGNQICIAP